MSWKCHCGTVNDDKWSRCVGCNGEYRNEFKIILTNNNEHAINSKDNIIAPAKIDPNSGFNLSHRITGLLFGISIACGIFIVVAKLSVWPALSYFIWKYLIYLIIISGLVGFLLGDKYYKQIKDFFDSATQKRGT
jgi:hypothetical protein